MKQKPLPLEKPSLLRVGAETIEVWPERCARVKGKCSQCYIEGKTRCAPRFDLSPRQVRPELVKSLSLQGKKLNEIARRTGLTLSEVYAERAKLRRAGVPLPRIHPGKGEKL